MNELMKRMKRKPKWKLEEERDDLLMEQKDLRAVTARLNRELTDLKDDLIKALEDGDTKKADKIKNEIEKIKEHISDNERHYKENADLLEVYSRILKNNQDVSASKASSIVGVVTGLGGLGLGIYGMRQAYKSDVEGTLNNKKILDWAKSLPIIRNIGNK